MRHFAIKRLLLTALSLGAIAACSRYEFVKPTCPEPEPEFSHSAIAWQRVGPAGSITGHIATLPNGAPLRDGQVRVGPGGAWHFADSLGRVVIGSVPRGADTLMVRQLGYVGASTRIDVSGDSGVTFLAVLGAARLRMFDGCGYVWAEHRKPWWKLW